MLRSRNLEAENGYIKYREHYQGEMYFEWIKLFWTPGWRTQYFIIAEPHIHIGN